MLIFHGLLTVFLVGIFFYDLTRYLIPNWMTAVILALWPAMLWFTPALPEGFVIWHSLVLMLMVFLAGIIVFTMRWMGGGDIKLITVLSLWTGTQASVEFLVYMALMGGGLVLLTLLLRRIAARFVPVEKAASLPRILRDREPVPYGIAITLAFLLLLWKGMIPGLPVA